jgi:hypothetical protein
MAETVRKELAVDPSSRPPYYCGQGAVKQTHPHYDKLAEALLKTFFTTDPRP